MDKQEFYLNQFLDHECSADLNHLSLNYEDLKLPEKGEKYLLKNNHLNEYISEDEKAQVRSNLGITPLLDELRNLILAKVFDEEGNISFDIEPHEDAYNKVLSSAVIYKILLNYYTKELLDNWSETIFRLISQKSDKDDTYTKKLIDGIIYGSMFINKVETIINNKVSQVLENIIPTKVSELENDSKYITQDNLKTINGLSILGSGNIEVEGTSGGGNSTKHIYLSQEEYDSLEEYEKDTLYFIIEQEDINWTFGNTFPIILQ